MPMRLERLTLALVLCAFSAFGAPAAFDLAQLTQLLAGKRSGEATFVEKREVSVLDRTVMTSGRLSFEAPDTFVRENLKPLRERVAVVGNTLTMSRGGSSRSVALDSVPEAAVVIEAIRGTLTGNRDALQRLFDASVAGSAEQSNTANGASLRADAACKLSAITSLPEPDSPRMSTVALVGA